MQATKNNSELVDKEIEEFLSCFKEKIRCLTREAFNSKVTALIKLKKCKYSHLGDEVERNRNEVVTQQYRFDRLAREIEALKSVTKSDLVSWYQTHRSSTKKVLSIHFCRLTTFGYLGLRRSQGPFVCEVNVTSHGRKEVTGSCSLSLLPGRGGGCASELCVFSSK
ncbi:nardilysin-like [Meleagris gallopavo]|uniref:nardilysin-like n=1 Tax=Meleagris gallopavo TaxID=9103 RepID=UPI00093AE1C5|nr:nardilysin-like [Meleagris gallopavo]